MWDSASNKKQQFIIDLERTRSIRYCHYQLDKWFNCFKDRNGKLSQIYCSAHIDFLRCTVQRLWTFSDILISAYGLSQIYVQRIWTFLDILFSTYGLSQIYCSAHMDFLKYAVQRIWTFSDIQFSVYGLSQIHCPAHMDFLRYTVQRIWTFLSG